MQKNIWVALDRWEYIDMMEWMELFTDVRWGGGQAPLEFGMSIPTARGDRYVVEYDVSLGVLRAPSGPPLWRGAVERDVEGFRTEVAARRGRGGCPHIARSGETFSVSVGSREELRQVLGTLHRAGGFLWGRGSRLAWALDNKQFMYPTNICVHPDRRTVCFGGGLRRMSLEEFDRMACGDDAAKDPWKMLLHERGVSVLMTGDRDEDLKWLGYVGRVFGAAWCDGSAAADYRPPYSVPWCLQLRRARGNHAAANIIGHDPLNKRYDYGVPLVSREDLRHLVLTGRLPELPPLRAEKEVLVRLGNEQDLGRCLAMLRRMPWYAWGDGTPLSREVHPRGPYPVLLVVCDGCVKFDSCCSLSTKAGVDIHPVHAFETMCLAGGAGTGGGPGLQGSPAKEPTLLEKYLEKCTEPLQIRVDNQKQMDKALGLIAHNSDVRWNSGDKPLEFRPEKIPTSLMLDKTRLMCNGPETSYGTPKGISVGLFEDLCGKGFIPPEPDPWDKRPFKVYFGDTGHSIYRRFMQWLGESTDYHWAAGDQPEAYAPQSTGHGCLWLDHTDMTIQYEPACTAVHDGIPPGAMHPEEFMSEYGSRHPKRERVYTVTTTRVVRVLSSGKEDAEASILRAGGSPAGETEAEPARTTVSSDGGRTWPEDA